MSPGKPVGTGIPAHLLEYVHKTEIAPLKCFAEIMRWQCLPAGDHEFLDSGAWPQSLVDVDCEHGAGAVEDGVEVTHQSGQHHCHHDTPRSCTTTHSSVTVWPALMPSWYFAINAITPCNYSVLAIIVKRKCPFCLLKGLA